MRCKVTYTHSRKYRHQLAIYSYHHEEEPQEKSRLWDIPKDNRPEVFNMSGRGGERQEMAESYNTLKTQEI